MGLCESKESANVVERRSDTAENHTDSKVHGGSNVPEEVPNSAKGGKFSEYYTLGKPIGQGTFSVVREAVCIKTGQKYAIKCIKRGGLSAEDIDALTTEVALLKQVESIVYKSFLRVEIDQTSEYYDTLRFFHRTRLLLSSHRVYGGRRVV